MIVVLDEFPWMTSADSVEVDAVATTHETTSLVGTVKWRARGGVTSVELDQLRRHRDRVPRADDLLAAWR
ncbi:MAG: hypothetical protein QM621_04210 [Aeromicrobium sp.]|uniref:hypothetical protein n=1 Tax=Aeromicrobium sp. TaxID=1871063 RepID=UPI0039E694BB